MCQRERKRGGEEEDIEGDEGWAGGRGGKEDKLTGLWIPHPTSN